MKAIIDDGSGGDGPMLENWMRQRGKSLYTARRQARPTMSTT
jgi:hypothetical protein